MRCLFYILLFVGALGSREPAAGQELGDVLTIKEPGQANAEQLETRHLTPAAEPDPALRYQFWPPVNQRRDINAMPMFSRAVLMLTEMSTAGADQRFSYERQQQWLTEEWNDEYAEEIETFLKQYQHVFGELERATDCMVVNYPLAAEQMSMAETMHLLLPEIQRSRELSRLLHRRARLEMHTGRWDEFARTMQTMFRLADMVGQSNELLVSRLVSFAIIGSAHRAIEEAASIAGNPNFYWALASVPHSLFRIRDAIDREVFGVLRISPRLADLPDQPIGPERSRQLLREVVTSATEMLGASASDPAGMDPTVGPLMAGMAAVTLAAPSREYLREQTHWGDRVENLSNSEAVLRAISFQLRRATSDYAKWAWLPRSIRSQYLNRPAESLRTATDGFPGVVTPAFLIRMLLPATEAANTASLRIEQEHALLATLESIRMSAAEEGELPRSIDDLIPPAWPDPLRDGGFVYEKLSPTSATMKRGERWSDDPGTIFKIELVK